MKWKSLLVLLLVCLSSTISKAQTWGEWVQVPVDTIKTDIFKVIYYEDYEQPLELWYTVKCPMGDASRSGMDFYTVPGIRTSNNADYENNVWDKGHLAPAGAFACDKETLKKTFSYLNCALQHEGLNRGPWKELEEFERGLAKITDRVDVHIIVCFDEEPKKVPGGAVIPSGFTKEITFNGTTITFSFPNKDVSGQDWGTFLILTEYD